MSGTSIQRTRTIAAPPDRVWATLAAFGEISGWAGNVDHSTLTSERADGVGAARRVQAGRVVLIETVIEWEPPHRLAYTLDGLPPLADRVVNRWDLAADPGDPDRTVATLTTEVEPARGPRGRIGVRILGRVLGKAADDLVDGLAAHDHTATGRTGA